MANPERLCNSQISDPAASPMCPDALLWYPPSELANIEESIAPYKIDSSTKQLLQEAVAHYQVEYLKDDPFVRESFPAQLTNKGRLQLLKPLIELCANKAPSSDIEKVLNKLDKETRQLLWPVGNIDHEKLRIGAESVLVKIGKRGPTPKRARLQFIRDLAEIFTRITGRIPGRNVHDQEQGDFLRFVKAALEPFKATQGCEADIKVVLAEIKKEKNESSTK
jgi:hypothetical protein